nr:immunoglobulin light chain junction region [Macaca mulatta]
DYYCAAWDDNLSCQLF